MGRNFIKGQIGIDDSNPMMINVITPVVKIKVLFFFQHKTAPNRNNKVIIIPTYNTYSVWFISRWETVGNIMV